MRAIVNKNFCNFFKQLINTNVYGFRLTPTVWAPNNIQTSQCGVVKPFLILAICKFKIPFRNRSGCPQSMSPTWRPPFLELGLCSCHKVVRGQFVKISDVLGWASSPEPAELSPFKPELGRALMRACNGLGLGFRYWKPKPGAQARALIYCSLAPRCMIGKVKYYLKL